MIGNLLSAIGSATFGAVGAVHDMLGGKQTPVSSQNIKAWETDEAYSVCHKTLMFYVGGTLVLGTLLGLAVCKVLPKMGKRKTTRRRRKTTTRRRSTYRRKK